MITHTKPISQVQTPQVWDEPTAAAQVGDEICAPFMPLVQVVERGIVNLTVK